jgi:hemerythrin-like metal-binding protein
MGLVQWDSKLDTGYPEIDQQHQALVDAFNRLHVAMKEGKGRDEVGNLLLFLKDYTVTHFRMEEELMDRHGYPMTTKHRAIHQALIAQVADLVERYQNGTMSLTLSVMDFLEDWLVTHIQGEDFRLAAFLHGKS